MNSDTLLTLKDDMIAYIAGHGLRRIPAFVGDDLPSILWDDPDNSDSWKEFVETAKAAGVAFLTMSEVTLTSEDISLLIDELHELNFPEEETGELEHAQALMPYSGKIGFLQLGFAHQGVMFVHETSTDWYEQYQQLLESIDDLSDIVFEQGDEDGLL